MSLENQNYEEAIITAQQSENEEVINYIVMKLAELNLKHYFSLALLRCYDQLQLEVVLEISWKFKLYEFSMPFVIQKSLEMRKSFELLEKKFEEKEKKDNEIKERESNLGYIADPSIGNLSSNLMLTGQMGNNLSGMNQSQQNQSQFGNFKF